MEPIFEQQGYVTDTFMKTSNVVDRLIREYEEHGSLIIAYDFDDTVKPSKPDYDCSYVEELLKELSKIDEMTLICFTCRSSADDLEDTKSYLRDHGIRCDYINENAPYLDMETSNKIFYNIFLEERAGLKSVYEQLVRFLYWYYHLRKEEESKSWDI